MADINVNYPATPSAAWDLPAGRLTASAVDSNNSYMEMNILISEQTRLDLIKAERMDIPGAASGDRIEPAWAQA
ncbi:hypothetical protein [Ottowia sp. VDI28]|uniref:hypothetical protein n=1 Tax=Ottowia sp. VDI28 TaxID=3133968 RepID=UPI003C2C8CD9